MRPWAQAQAAIECLDQIIAGKSVNAAVKDWARAHRFAGSSDRAAIRDFIFDILRHQGQYSAGIAAPTGRDLMMRHAVHKGIAAEIFCEEPHAPHPMSADEVAKAQIPLSLTPWEAANLPEWAYQNLFHDYGPKISGIAQNLCEAAALDLRVNRNLAARAEVISDMEAEGFLLQDLEIEGGLRVLGPKRAVQTTRAYQKGWIEIQDANSQRASQKVARLAGRELLDYCAGGGGKALAIASYAPEKHITVWDASMTRLKALKERATRAREDFSFAPRDPIKEKNQFDIVMVDAPCSGSGAWRREVEEKWTLDEAGFQTRILTQRQILAQVKDLVRLKGALVYMTCSIFHAENEQQMAKFLTMNQNFERESEEKFLPSVDGDGFFISILRKKY